MSKLYRKDEEIQINVKPITQFSDNSNLQLFNTIKDIVEEKKEIKKEVKKFFTVSKTSVSFNLDDSILFPSKLAILSIKNFEDIYYKQLENLIFTSKEDIDPNNLLPLLLIMNYIVKKKYPITLTSNKGKKLLIKITNVMNKYFNTNYNVLYSMYTMFNSILDTEGN